MSLRIALFGQAPFGRDVLVGLCEAGHEIVGVYAPPEDRRPDPTAEEARKRGLTLLQPARFRRRGNAIAEREKEHASLRAELNVLAYWTIILPEEIVDAPKHRSLCFHPSLLPAFRGGSAIPWQIILGARETGVTIFRPDAGVDTGPIVVQKGGVSIEPHDNAASLYYDKLYPLGVAAMLEAVAAVDAGTAEYRPQPREGASHQSLLSDVHARIDWSLPAERLDRLVRGCDPSPGAHAQWGEQTVRLHDGSLLDETPDAPPGQVVREEDGALVIAARGGALRVGRMRIQRGKKQPAASLGLAPGERLR